MGESLGDAVLRLVADSAPLKRELGAAHAFTLGRIKSMGMASKAAMAAAIAGAAVAVGVGLTKVGEAFDTAFDKIAAKTGATGKRLESLKDDFREVFRTVPNSAEEVATAIGEVHRRLDLVGKPLQERSRQFLTLSRITGTDLEANIAAGARAFQDWEVPVKRQGAALDGFMAISQKTGASVDQLLTSVVQFGAPLRNFGFSIEQAAAMFAGFEEAGVNMTTTMSGMRLGVGNLADPTDELKQQLKELGLATAEPQEQFLGIIAAMGEAKTEQEALGIAIDVFGRRAANDMKEAVKQGRFEVEDLMKTFRRGKGSIADTAKETDDWRESLATLRNKGMLAIEKPAMMMIAVLTLLAEGAGVVFDAFDSLPGPIKGVAVALGILAIASAFNPWVTLIAGTIALIGIVKQHWPEIRRVINSVLRWMRNAFDDVKGWLVRTFGPAFRWLKNAWENVGNFIRDVWGWIKGAWRDGAHFILGIVSTILDAIAKMADAGSKIPGPIGDMWDKVQAGAEDAADAINRTRDRMKEQEETAKRNAEQASRNEKAFKSLGKVARGEFGEMARISKRDMGEVRKAMERGSQRGRDAIADNFWEAAGAIRRAIKRGEIDSKKGMAEIERLMLKGLKAYGIQDPAAVLAKTELGGKGGGGSPAGRKLGGGVPIPGFGEGDKVPVTVGGVPVAMTEPGERMFILNRNANSALDRLQALNGAVPRQAGGFVDLWGTGLAHLQLGGVAPEAANLARQVMDRFGGSISSGLRPGDPGFHGSGQAFDWVGGDWAGAARFMNQIGPKLLEGIYNPSVMGGPAVSWDSGSQVPSSFWGGSTWAGHDDHIHAAIAAMIEGMMAGRIKLPRFMALTQFATAAAQGLNNISFGLEERLNANLGGVGDESAFVSAGGAFSKPELARLWRQANGGFGDPNLMAAIALAESAGDPNAFGPPSGRGLWQIEWDVWANTLGRLGSPEDPLVNAKMAGEVLKAQGLGAWVVYNTGAYQQFMQEGGLLDLAGVRGFAKGGIVDLIDAFVGDYKQMEGAGDRRKLISETARRIKESKQLGVDKLSPDGSALAGGLDELRAQADVWGEWASHASSLNTAVDLKIPESATGTTPRELLAGLSVVNPFTGQQLTMDEMLRGLGGQSVNPGDTVSVEVPGIFQDRTEAEWLGGKGDLPGQLHGLFELRNALVVASESLEKVRERVRKMVDAAKKQLDKVKKAIKDGEKERRQLEKKRRQLEKQMQKASDDKERDNKLIEQRIEREMEKPPKKRDEEQIRRWREQLNSKSSEKDAIRDELRRNAEQLAALEEKQIRRGQLRDALKGPISDALGTRIQAVHSGQTTLADELNLVQGTGFDTEWLPQLPDLGALGGEIFDVQLQLRELGAVEPPITDTPEPAEEEGFSISELLDLAEAIRFGVFDQDLISQAPTLHGGGVVGAGGDFGGTDEVIRRLLPDEGVIDQQTMRDGIPLAGGRYRFVVENWEQGRGYFERVADNRIDEADRETAGRYRAGVPS